MKVIENKVIQVEGWLCEICGNRLKQNGDGTYLSTEGAKDYCYTLHTKCLIELLNKLLVLTPKR